MAKKGDGELSPTLDNPWGLTSKGKSAKQMASQMLSLTHGMYAKIPIVCKGDACPYAKNCHIEKEGLAPRGEFCPVEIATIEMRAMGYLSDVPIDSLSFTDKALLSELVALDVMLERSKSLIASDVTPVVEMPIGTDERGAPILQPMVARSWEAYERISKRRESVYQLLLLTRKDKAKDKKEDAELSTAELFKQVIASDVDMSIEGDADEPFT